jgi:hypothetical protein
MPSDTSLDFEKADFGAPAGDLRCSTCSSEIRDRYFEVNGATICARCRASLAGLERPEGGFKRFVLATVFGMAGGALGALVWYAVARLFSLEIGLIAILVGWLVGTGVHRGAEGRGGRGYQLLAAFVTYASIVTTYIPPIYAELSKAELVEPASESTAEGSAAATAATATPEAASAPTGESDPAPSPAPVGASAPASASKVSDAVPEITFAGAVGGLLLAGAILYAIAFAAPFLMGFENIIGILIIGFAVYQAWSMNVRRVLDVKGPFRVAARPVVVAAPPSDDNAHS